MNHDVIITCALTGAGDTTAKSPHVPVTPKQIAAAAVEAAILNMLSLKVARSPIPDGP